MPIKNLSDARRLPRLGTIALGVKKKAANGKEFPSEVDYFVCPPAVQKVFGEKPKELRIMFPVNNDEVFFQQWNKCYGASALKCKGDGERAWAWDDELGGLKEIPCPCPKLEAGDCKPIGTLQFLLPEVAGAGIWQITTSSKNSIIDINSSIAFIRGVAGRINMIPLILKREERQMTRTEDGKQKKSVHYTMKIDVAEGFTLKQLQQAAQVQASHVLLPPADETKDDLLYPANGFKPDEGDKPDLTAEATPEELAGVATWVSEVKDRGRDDALVYSKMHASVGKRLGVTITDDTTWTHEMAAVAVEFLKGWAENIDAKK